jgi:radical SAM protein with 4Fe4S-binding SPASM domain
MSSVDRRPLVLIPQYFGCLIFDRRTSRYLPFDAEATALLTRLVGHPIDAVVADVAGGDERDAIERFIDCYYSRGFFDLRGRLDAEVRGLVPPADHLAGPLAVHLEIIGACNLTCSHCFAGELPRNHDPLTLVEMDTLFGDLSQLGSMRLGLTGGEPLLRRDLFDVLDAAVAHGLHPCLTTNGLMIDDRIARELGRRDLVWLNVSLDGPDESSNDAIRGAGTFAQVVANLKVLARHARFTLAFTIMKTNAHLVEQCAELAYQVGAHTAVFRPLYPAGVALDHLELMPSFEEYSGALRMLASMDSPGADLRALDPFGPETRAGYRPEIHTSHSCGAGQHVCSISVQGDVNPCSFLGPNFNSGNIRSTPFAQIWNQSQVMHRMRRPLGRDGFQDGCRARSQAFAGSVDAPDPWFDEFRGQRPHRRVPLPLHPSSNVYLERHRTSPMESG